MKNMWKISWSVTWPLLVIATGLAFLAGCSKPHQVRSVAQPELPTVAVRTQKVENKTLPAVEEVVGTVRAKLHATIEAKASGRITEMPIVLGQRIAAGQLLARLDAPEIKARLEQVEATLQQAERDRKRLSSLLDQEAATRADYETADARYLVAKGAVAEARAMMGYVEILAPFDGVVTRKLADVGDLAAPGKPLLTLEDPAKLQLEADVPEAVAAPTAPQKRDAQSPVLLGAQLAVRLGQTEISGTVAEIAPVADPVSRTFRMKLDLPATQGLMSGQFARLLIPVGETTSIHVPSAAVMQRGQMEIVFAVENQHAQLHLVKTGRQFKDETEILSGLDSGDSVVVENPAQLSDGQPLQVK